MPGTKYSDFLGTKASMVLVLGETGVGKSFFIDKLAPGKVKIGHGLKSCTQDSQLVEAKVGGTEVFLIDTPGFDDTLRSDGDILLTISRMITAQYQLGIKLKGIIYVHSILSPRMRQSSIRQLELFRKICGDENLENVLLVTTGWSSGPTNARFGQRERELRNEYWEPLINGGAKALRFYGTRDSAASIVSQLLGKEEVVLALQREIVDRNLKLSETSAGFFATSARGFMEKEYQGLIADEKVLGGIKSPRLDDLRRSLERSRDDNEKLRVDVLKEVERNIEKKVETEFRKDGKRPIIVDIISWLIGLASMGLSICNVVGAF